MKTRKLCLVLFYVSFTADLFAQGSGTTTYGVVRFNLLNVPPEKRIYVGDWIDVNFHPEFVSWQPCSGPRYRVALYWGAAGETDDRNMRQVGASAGFLTGVNAGTFFGGGRTITTVGSLNGPVLSFQVRAWDSGEASTALTWEQAAVTTGILGKGPIFELDTRDPTNVLEISPQIWEAPGYRGFIFGADGVTQILVPEPPAVALGIVGLGVLGGVRALRRKA